MKILCANVRHFPLYIWNSWKIFIYILTAHIYIFFPCEQKVKISCIFSQKYTAATYKHTIIHRHTYKHIPRKTIIIQKYQQLKLLTLFYYYIIKYVCVCVYVHIYIQKICKSTKTLLFFIIIIVVVVLYFFVYTILS